MTSDLMGEGVSLVTDGAAEHERSEDSELILPSWMFLVQSSLRFSVNMRRRESAFQHGGGPPWRASSGLSFKGAPFTNHHVPRSTVIQFTSV